VERLSTVEIALVAAAFVGQAIASYVVGTRRGHRKAIVDGAPSVFGESFLRRAEEHFKSGHQHANVLQTHELKIATLNASILKIEAQFALAEAKLGGELKELREMSTRIREDIASLRGALGANLRLKERGDAS